MNKRTLFQKVLTVGLASAIGFSTLLASGAEPVQAQSATSTAVSKGSQVVNYGKNFWARHINSVHPFPRPEYSTALRLRNMYSKSTALLCLVRPQRKRKRVMPFQSRI